MKTQNFKNHGTLNYLNRLGISFYCLSILLAIGTFANFFRAIQLQNGRITAGLWVLTSIVIVLGYFLYRSYSLKAQDRAIRAEENLRHFVLCGKLLPAQLSIHQIVALRFAPDEEFIALSEQAVKNNLSNKEIKLAVKNWRADYHRA